MATTNTRPAECCEASVVGRQQNYASAMGEPKGSHACWAERSPEGGFGILHGVATGTASRAIRGAAPSSHSGDAGNLPILAATLAVDAAALIRGARRAVRPCRLRGGLAVFRSHGGASLTFAAPVAACTAREMGPPRRGEDCAGAFSQHPRHDTGGVYRSRKTHGPITHASAEGERRSTRRPRAFPFREVTK